MNSHWWQIMADIDREYLLRDMRRLAIEAGRVIMEIYHREEMGVREKADASPVTEADEAADRLIASGLRHAYPDIPLVTEEQSESHELQVSTFFIVDPLDGTKEFVKRRGDFTVNIALVEEGVPTLGVVYAPAKGRLFITGAHSGAEEETGDFDTEVVGNRRQISVLPPENAALRIVASKSHRDQATDDYIANYSVGSLVSAGSSLKFCLVAAGEADFYPRLGPTMEWDTAAGDAVLRAVGGKVVDRETLQQLQYGKPEFRNSHFLAYSPGVVLVQE